ncbi:MAG: hypothetical protein ACRDGM_18225 [bacterium]
MSDSAGSAISPPTFYGNIATAQINTDELVLEIRSIRLPHSKIGQSSEAPMIDVPPVTPQEAFSVEPVARVVLTFNAARSLQSFLVTAIATMDQRRRGGA